MARVFVIDGREHADPDTRMTIDEVRQDFANFYAELANATTPAKPARRRGDDEIWEFEKKVGVKGG